MSKMAEKRLYHQQAVGIWEGFCQLHQQLYDLTCEEYLTLLASDIDKLESMLPIKEELIQQIGHLENERSQLIDTINTGGIATTTINKAIDLLSAFQDLDNEAGIPVLRNLNSLLIDIIEKIQDQNKKNQLFLNKAMISLKEVKQGFTGKKTYTTYGADGLTRSLNR
jgi:flagellar biosynthesis/type III secretory pathway chaperone